MSAVPPHRAQEAEIRLIACLLLADGAFVKTTRFADPVYIGDPINTLRIFNEKETPEICILDIGAARGEREPDLALLESLASECFMPASYGGGIRTVETAGRILSLGYEKVALNAAAIEDPGVITAIADRHGRQSVIVSVDVRTGPDGRRRVMGEGGTEDTGLDVVSHCRAAVEAGAGEILLTSVDREGTLEGLDHDLIRLVGEAVDVPVIAHGGARDADDVVLAVARSGADAVAAGAMVVFYGRHRAVLVNPPTRRELIAARRALAGAD